MLKVNKLSVDFVTENGVIKAVRGVDLSVSEGEFIGIVGESGCGKSTLALSILNLVDPPSKVSGNIGFEGVDILKMNSDDLCRIRGRKISMIFQDPFSSLNPVISVGEQIMEVLVYHEKMNRQEAQKRTLELLGSVKIDDPKKRFYEYPHQLSGGMKQRIMIAQAVASRPKLIIADEPTTALDVTVQKEIIDLLLELRKQLNMAVILITHNIALISRIADRIYVMYAGEVMEEGPTDIIKDPRNPYTYSLVDCLPDGHDRGEPLNVITGRPPDMREDFKGCSFLNRCKYSRDICKTDHPGLLPVSSGHSSRCVRMAEIKYDE